MMRIQLVVLITSWLTDGVVALSPRAPSSRAITTTDSLASTCIEEKQPTVQPSQQQSATARPRNDGSGVFDMEDWKWCYSSNWDIASTAYKCSDIEGTVPADLRGTLFRNGPGNFQRGNKRYEHTLDGDGFIASWKFSEDSVEYRGRFVETEYFLKEQQQDAILYRNTFGTQREGGILANALDVKLKNVANTNAVSFGDRLFALWEAGKPYELDPNTLETMPDSNDVPPFTGLGLSTAPSGYCRVETKTNTIQTWWTETRVFTEEVVVVPKRNPETNEPRDECWLLGVLHDAQENRSSLAIVDGDDIEKGPVCRIHLKHPLAYSLHGTFAPSKI
jgi:all-trans-8'-apo-beta-carotenal 15,15'-oxygenase